MAREERKQLLEEKNIHLWFSGSPVALCTMRLELNISAGAIFAYSKMLNVQPEHIREVVFDLICYDSVRRQLEVIENYRYANLDIPRNGVFGMETPIKIKNSQTRNIEFVLKTVTTVSGDTWVNESKTRFNINLEQESIYNVMGNLHRQFLDNCAKRDYDHTKLIHYPVFDDMHWMCACGTLNWNDEALCSGCGVEREWLKHNTQKDLLKEQEKQRTLEAEKVRREAAAKERADKEKQREEFRKRKEDYAKQNKKIESRKKARITFFVVFAITILLGGSFAVYTFGVPYIRYNRAVSAMNDEKFDEAIKKFDQLNGYLDSDELKKKCVYSKAMKSFYAGDMKEAAGLFESVKEYMDSEKYYLDSKLSLAEQYIEEGELLDAYNTYSELGKTKENSEEMKKCMEQLYKYGEEQFSANHLYNASAAFEILGDYKKSKEKKTECTYLLAKRAYGKLEYGKCLELYRQIKGYKDVDQEMKHLSNMSVILSTAPDDENPAVWEAYNVNCPECGNKTNYKFEFSSNGRYKFTVECDKHEEPIVSEGKYKIEDSKVFLSKYINGISTWIEKGTVVKTKNNVKDVEGKNIAVIMTDPLLADNKTKIILYSNKN